MRAFRESGLGQLFFGLIIVAIILAFVLSGNGPNLSDIGEDCAAEIGDHCVEPKEFYAAYGLVASIGLNEKAAEQMRLREVVAKGLAERELLLAEAKRLGIATSDDAVDAELVEGRTRVSLPAEGAERLATSLALCIDGPSGCEPGTVGLRALPVKKNGAFDFELYKRMVRVATGRSPGHFKEMQARELTAERLRELYRSSVRVSEDEAYLAYSRVRSQAIARFTTANASWFERYVTVPKSADVEAWKSSHEAELKQAVEQAKAQWKPGCPVVQELRLEPEASESTDDMIARAKKLLPAKDFDLLARRHSRSESALLGGRVGCLDASFGPGHEELLQAADKLKAGEVSEPVTTLRGVHLVRLVDKVSEENVEALAREYFAYKFTSAALGQEATRQFAVDLIAALGAKKPIADATDELVQAALARGPLGDKDNPGLTDDLRPRSDISRAFSIEQNPLPEAVGNKSPAQLVFDLAEPDDVVAEPVPLRGGFAVLQLKEKDLMTREKFAEERERVIAQLQARKAEDALRQEVGRLVEKAGGIRLNEKHVPPPKATTPEAPKLPG